MIDSLHDALWRSRELGFLGPGPVEDHIRHALAFASAVTGAPARAIDIGAGGGLPGLVLAVEVWPECHWTFLDSQRKRMAFLEEVVHDLGLTERVDVVTERAEVFGREAEHRDAYDLVVARSFGPPAVTAECSSPLLRAGGSLVVSEPPEPSEERWPAEGLAEVGFGIARQFVDPGPPPTHLVVMTRNTEAKDRYPRRVGIPSKRPIF